MTLWELINEMTDPVRDTVKRYQTDFAYDTAILAQNQHTPTPQHWIWFLRDHGTWLVSQDKEDWESVCKSILANTTVLKAYNISAFGDDDYAINELVNFEEMFKEEE